MLHHTIKKSYVVNSVPLVLTIDKERCMRNTAELLKVLFRGACKFAVLVAYSVIDLKLVS